MVKKYLKKSVGSERLSFTELSTVLFEIENVLNNRPLCFTYDDDVSEILTSNSLLYGRKLEFENKCVDAGYIEVDEGNDLWLRKCAMKIVESFWLMWHREYLDGFREISGRKVGLGASEIRVGDVAVIKGSDGYVRGAKVKVGGKNIIRRPVNRLYPTEVRWSDPWEQNLSHTKDTIND